MFPTSESLIRPVRLAITAVIPVGSIEPCSIVVTLDPPNDRYEVVWHQDTITDVLTPEEALQAIHDMTYAALQVLSTGKIHRCDLPPIVGQDGPSTPVSRPQVPGQQTLV